MHFFALIIASLCSHPIAAAVIKRAQAIVCFFKASHQPYAELRKEAKLMGIDITLKSSNATSACSQEVQRALGGD